jgi:hypothetical protein
MSDVIILAASLSYRLSSMELALVIVERYPQLSETYIAAEVAALDRAGVLGGVFALKEPDCPLVDHVPFEMVEGARDVVKACGEIQPTVLHTHYLHMAPIAVEVSNATGLPFTLRTHSYDVIKRPKERVKTLCAMLNASNCAAVLGFPFILDILRDHGLREDLITPSFPVIDSERFLDRSPNGEGILNLGAAIVKKDMKGYVKFASKHRRLRFSLYPIGDRTQELLDYNTKLGSPVDIHESVQPPEMPAVYKANNWLVYTASLRINMVGWPMAVAEAQASGLGVCLQTNRPDAAEYLGGAGVAFRRCREIADLVSGPVPEEMRERGFEVAARSDVKRHIQTLEEIWSSAS